MFAQSIKYRNYDYDELSKLDAEAEQFRNKEAAFAASFARYKTAKAIIKSAKAIKHRHCRINKRRYRLAKAIVKKIDKAEAEAAALLIETNKILRAKEAALLIETDKISRAQSAAKAAITKIKEISNLDKECLTIFEAIDRENAIADLSVEFNVSKATVYRISIAISGGGLCFGYRMMLKKYDDWAEESKADAAKHVRYVTNINDALADSDYMKLLKIKGYFTDPVPGKSSFLKYRHMGGNYFS